MLVNMHVNLFEIVIVKIGLTSLIYYYVIGGFHSLTTDQTLKSCEIFHCRQSHIPKGEFIECSNLQANTSNIKKPTKFKYLQNLHLIY